MEVLCLKSMTTKNLAMIGMLAALGAVFMVFRFPIPFLPPFLSFDLALIPELIGGFALGPWNAFAIIIVRVLIQLIINGSNSMFTGELQSILLSLAFIMPASIYYLKHKTRKDALIGMLVGIMTCTVIAVFTNLYLIIPFYIALYQMDMSSIIAMCHEVNPAISSVEGMVLMGIIPFNLIKTGINGVITFLVYKKISPLIHQFAKNDRR